MFSVLLLIVDGWLFLVFRVAFAVELREIWFSFFPGGAWWLDWKIIILEFGGGIRFENKNFDKNISKI